MKTKTIFRITAGLMLIAVAGFGQNSNTTYGGVTQDALTNGKFTTTPVGSFNAGFGTNAFGPTGAGTPSGSANAVIGYESMFNVTSGSNNTAAGYESLFTDNIGTDNTAAGYQSL